jgi:antitoxin MazE
MIKTLTKLGDGYALIIDQMMLDRIRATADSQFEITSDGHSLLLTPVRDPERENKVKAALDKVNARHGGALKKLAE